MTFESIIGTNYAKDKDHVFYGRNIILDADLLSFSVIYSPS